MSSFFKSLLNIMLTALQLAASLYSSYVVVTLVFNFFMYLATVCGAGMFSIAFFGILGSIAAFAAGVIVLVTVAVLIATVYGYVFLLCTRKKGESVSDCLKRKTKEKVDGFKSKFGASKESATAADDADESTETHAAA